MYGVVAGQNKSPKKKSQAKNQAIEDKSKRLGFTQKVLQYVRKKLNPPQEEESESVCVSAMGARRRPEGLAALAKGSRFSAHEIKLMYRGFKQECPSGVVDEDTFKHIFSQFFPLGDASQYAHLVFNTIKHKQSGNVNFEEFLEILSRVARGSVQEKVSWVFALYDLDGDGRISRTEMEQVVCAVYELLGRAAGAAGGTLAARDHVDRIFHLMDTNSDGVVTPDELWSWCRRDPALLRSLHALDTVLCESARASCSTAKESLALPASPPRTPSTPSTPSSSLLDSALAVDGPAGYTAAGIDSQCSCDSGPSSSNDRVANAIQLPEQEVDCPRKEVDETKKGSPTETEHKVADAVTDLFKKEVTRKEDRANDGSTVNYKVKHETGECFGQAVFDDTRSAQFGSPHTFPSVTYTIATSSTTATLTTDFPCSFEMSSTLSPEIVTTPTATSLSLSSIPVLPMAKPTSVNMTTIMTSPLLPSTRQSSNVSTNVTCSDMSKVLPRVAPCTNVAGILPRVAPCGDVLPRVPCDVSPRVPGDVPVGIATVSGVVERAPPVPARAQVCEAQRKPRRRARRPSPPHRR